MRYDLQKIRLTSDYKKEHLNYDSCENLPYISCFVSVVKIKNIGAFTQNYF